MSVPSYAAAPASEVYSTTPAKRRRFGEDAKFLPIAFVVGTIASLYCIYVFHHCIPLLQLDVEPHLRNSEQKTRGTVELVIFHYVTIMTLICYVKAILVHPGKVPDCDPNWEYYPQDRGITDFTPVSLVEKKKTGDRRHCKWCGKYKPDRCHHCRVCKTCILKMDHHCPWLYNCVGFNNYKFFFCCCFTPCLICILSSSPSWSLCCLFVIRLLCSPCTASFSARCWHLF